MSGSQPYRYWGLACAVVVVVLLTGSCSKKRSGGEAAPPPAGPAITDVDPGTGFISGGTRVTISTAGFQDDFTLDVPEVFFGSDLAAVTPLDSTTVTAVTPPHGIPETVDVEVRATGTVESATLVGGFTYTAIPCTISSILPAFGPTTGGFTVFVEGDSFDLSPAPVVEFGPGNAAPFVTPWSSTRLEVEAPPGPAGIVDVIVTTQSGPCTLQGAFEYVGGPPPGGCTVSAVTPRQGHVDGGTVVVVTGTGFDTPPASRPTVEFGQGNLGTDYANVTSTSFEVTTPAGAPGLVDIIITNRTNVCVLRGGYEYLPPPPCSVFSIDPTMGPEQGGAEVTILGSSFTLTGLNVWFGATQAQKVNFIDETELRVQAPPGTGMVDVTVDLWGSSLCTLPFAYEYAACAATPCQLSNLRPDTGGIGEVVELSGQRFEPGSTVLFGGAQALVLDETGLPRKLVVEAPTPSWGETIVDVQVLHPSGVCCSKADAFTYAGCTLLSLTHTWGPEGGGQPLAVRGSGFSVNPPPEVWFGAHPCPLVLPQDSMEIIVMTPPAMGQDVVDVMVINPDGGICICPGCYDYYTGCTIDSIVPDSGGTNGGNLVTITGTEFNGYQAFVKFGDIYADLFNVIVSPDGKQLTFDAPPSYTGGAKDVHFINRFVSECTVSGGYTYVLPGTPPCGVTSIDPGEGPIAGGTTVTIRGMGFDQATGVLFGPVSAAQVIYKSPNEIEAVTREYYGPLPVRIPGVPLEVPVDVVVAPGGVDPCIQLAGFTFKEPATPTPGVCSISGLSPNTGAAAGGDTITVTGSGFSRNNPVVSFGMVWGETTFVDENTLSVVVPASVTGAGPIDVYYAADDWCYTPPPGCQGCYTYQ